MPDFTAAFTVGTGNSVYTDPNPPADKADRLNVISGKQHRQRTGTVDAVVEVTCTVDGVPAPTDASLGGRLFSMWLVESPFPGYIGFTPQGGKTSVQRFTPLVAGHYTVGVRRAPSAVEPQGGAILLHLDVA